MAAKRIPCVLEGLTDCWIERKNPVSIRLWDEWKISESAERNRELILQLITAWKFPNADDPSKEARQPAEGIEALKDLELRVLPWLVHAIGDSLVKEFVLDPLVLTPLSSPTATESKN